MAKTKKPRALFTPAQPVGQHPMPGPRVIPPKAGPKKKK